MKKFRYLLSVLALALVVAGASKAMPAAADEAGKAAALTPAPDYAKEVVEVKGGANVYYQVVKDAAVTTLKANNWLPATKKADNDYLIDISAFTKSGFVAVTTDNTVTDAKDFKVVAVLAPVKSLKLTLDFKKDVPNNLYDALAYAYGVNVDTAITGTYNLGGTAEKKDDLASFLATYTLAWKRGVNGTWAKASQTALATVDADFQQAYTMLRSSNSTLYVRVVESAGKDTEKAAVLPSKEVKIKIAKTAAAPAIKVNYQTGVIPFKNGQEIFDPVTNFTYYIPAYDKNSDNTFKLTTAANATTKTKVTGLTIAEILDRVNTDRETAEKAKIAAGAAFTLKYRTTATAKKYASWYGTLNLKNVAAAPAAKASKSLAYTANGAGKTLVLDFTQLDAAEDRTLEYAIAGADVDQATLKWTKVEDITKTIDLNKFYGKEIKYKDASKADKTVKYEAATVFFRYAAVVDKNAPEKNVFPSAIGSLSVTTVPTVTLTFANDPEAKVVVKDAEGVKLGKTVVVEKNKAYNFTVEVTDVTLTVLTVKAGEESLTGNKGVYTVTPTDNVTITVKAVAPEPTT